MFVALANGGGLSAGNGIGGVEGNALACAVLIALIDASLPCAAGSAANVARWRAGIAPRPELAPDPAVLPQYTGSYRRPNGEPARIFIERGQLWWQTTLGPYAMTQEAPDRFFMKADDHTLVFMRDESGRVTHVDITWPGDPATYSLPRM